MDIDCVDISVILSGQKIIDNIDLHVGSKKFVGIIGPNGSGKSTLLKCIYRILKPSQGTIFMNGKSLSEYTLKESAQNLAVVSQHNSFNFDFTVREVVLMGRAPYKKTMERDMPTDFAIAEDSLAKVGMLSYAERSFSILSGGEQQRVILARALTQRAKCLVLDEPTNHLDIKHQINLLNLVKTLDITIISALHDLNMAAMYCDYIYVLKDGKIKGHGEPKKILTPQFIKEIYEVDADVIEVAPFGKVHVIFKSISED